MPLAPTKPDAVQIQYTPNAPGATPINMKQALDAAALTVNQNTFTKSQSVSWVTLTSTTSLPVNASLSNNFRVTLLENATLENPTNLVDGQVVNFKVKQDATGSRLLTFGSKYKFAGGAPTASTAANAIDFMSCVYDSSDDILICAYGKGIS